VTGTANQMLVKRLLVAILLVPPGIGFIALGGWPYGLLITLILGGAAWEYWNLFRIGGYAPSQVLIIGGVVGLALLTMIRPDSLTSGIVFLTLAAMTYHLVDFERGRDKPATDFGITLGGVLYLGLIGSYLISLRNLPEGKWWVLLVLPSVWLADSGAFIIGSRFGIHKLSPRLSPKKTWEGYFAGIVFGTAGGALLAALWHLMSPAMTIERGALVGFLMGTLTPLGDLGESMIKRQAGVKDSSQILPGHGGVLDRIDSWLWAGVIGYYVIQLLK
jgi:phosphatidate cytidylyltransferase